ncbi:MAG: signal peptidase I [Clostridia bacterium]|nr:signal peptidase I [Clostridia bacterium]
MLVIIAVTVGLNVYNMNAASLTGNAVPMPFGVGAAVVLSGSMEPELSVGDLMIVVERESYNVRDVVVYQDGRTAVVHRIKSIDGDTVITRGDANDSDDSPIQKSQIKGEVVFVMPLVGYAVNVIKTPACTIIIIAAAIWLLERSFRKEKEKDDEEMEKIKEEIRNLIEEQKKK